MTNNDSDNRYWLAWNQWEIAKWSMIGKPRESPQITPLRMYQCSFSPPKQRIEIYLHLGKWVETPCRGVARIVGNLLPPLTFGRFVRGKWAAVEVPTTLKNKEKDGWGEESVVQSPIKVVDPFSCTHVFLSMKKKELFGRFFRNKASFWILVQNNFCN